MEGWRDWLQPEATCPTVQRELILPLILMLEKKSKSARSLLRRAVNNIEAQGWDLTAGDLAMVKEIRDFLDAPAGLLDAPTEAEKALGIDRTKKIKVRRCGQGRDADLCPSCGDRRNSEGCGAMLESPILLGRCHVPNCRNERMIGKKACFHHPEGRPHGVLGMHPNHRVCDCVDCRAYDRLMTKER